MSKILIVLSALLLLAFTPSVKADPLVITSGSLTVPGFFRAPQYSFAGQNFSVTGHGSDPGAPPSCFPCASGDVINLSSFFAGSSLGTGSLTVDGTTFDNLFFAGHFQFTAGTVQVPATTTDISVTAPFTFSGNFFACPLEIGGPDCTESKRVFSAEFVGQGIATLQLQFSFIHPNGTPIFSFGNITYTFENAEIPEPMTISLLAVGLTGLALNRARARKRKVGP